MECLEANAIRRKEIWEAYQIAFQDLSLGLPAPEEAGTYHARHLYTILVDAEKCGVSRDKYLAHKTAHHIGVGVHYLSIPEHPYFQQRFGWLPEVWPNAMRIGWQTVSLPMSGCLSDEDVQDVIAAVKDTLA